MHRRLFLAGMGAALAAAGCQSESRVTAAPAGVCDRSPAEALTGRGQITDAQAKRLTGATMVRQIRPGDPVTMDFRRERVTIETDPKTGRIVRAFCG